MVIMKNKHPKWPYGIGTYKKGAKMLLLTLLIACGEKEQDSAVETATEQTEQTEDTAAEQELEDTAQDTAA